MAYRDDISNLGADHHWDFDGDSTDQIGAVNGTDTSVLYSSAAIAEDASVCMETNAFTDQVSLPTTTDINNSAQARKAVCGWFMPTDFQPHPVLIYSEGIYSLCFSFVLAFGNQVMLEIVEQPDINVQVFGPSLQPNRAYHLCGIFEGNGYGNELRFYVDGVKQTSAEPSDAAPDTANLDARAVGRFGDTTGTIGVGSGIVLLQSAINGKYNHWATWGDEADAVLTDTEIREELFEKGALPGVLINTDTEANMQADLDTYANTASGNEPLNIRVSGVSGGGDFTLNADNITHDPLTSIHVQYMGTDTLTWRNLNGSNASIGSTPNGGTIVFATPVNTKVTVKDASNFEVIKNARVYLLDTSSNTVINAVTNANGVVSGVYDYIANEAVTGYVRKGTIDGGFGEEHGHWCPSLDIANSGTTNLNDFSGSGNHGTLDADMAAATAWVENTEAGGLLALDFDGINDLVNMGSDILIGTSDFATSVWFKASTTLTTSSSGGRVFQSRGTGGGGTQEGFQLCLKRNGSTVRIDNSFLDDAGGSAAEVFNNLYIGTTNTWHHMVVNWDRDDTAELFIDGVSLATSSITVPDGSIDSTRDFTLGAADITESQYYKGLIDDVRIFKRLLTQEEIDYLYRDGLGRGVTGGPNSIYYKQASVSTTITSTGFDIDVLMVRDI